jgi:hypothetical protein
MPREAKENQRGYGPVEGVGPGHWPEVWPVDWNKEIGAVQARDHYARPGEAAQGHLTGRVIPQSNNAGSDITPAVQGGRHESGDSARPEGNVIPATNPLR